jgi:chromosome segregation protein
MYLKEINLKGFKSFPDRTRLSFSQGVSVIVGPNGCGKSNITDAVLWALGEQSPLAVRGQSMRDVIFAGGQGQSRRRFAEVEVVIDNSEGLAASEFSEISITRRIERNGDGEYRLNGARCRLADVLEVLSDTNMGREMHSVISQGRVEAIVNSKPRDRRLLIEEAAGLGKHRKRRHRAQLKLDRTGENLDRAVDVEREARSRLRPLKRQAEAAERTAKLVTEEAELRARLVAGDMRSHQDQLAGSEQGLTAIRTEREQLESKLEEVRKRRSAIEEKVATGEDERREQGERLAQARGAVERVRARSEAVAAAVRDLRSGLGERQLRLEQLDEGPEIGRAAIERVAELEAALKALGEGEPGGELAELREAAEQAEKARAEAEGAMPALTQTAEHAAEALNRANAARDAARAEASKAAERRAALEGDLAAVEAKLARAAMEGSDEVFAGLIETGPGIERALSAALGERLRAAVVSSVDEGVERLADSDGASRALVAGGEAASGAGEPPAEGARRLLDLVEADGPAREVADRLLADAWLVDDLTALPPDFSGIAVTVDGDAFDGGARELRRLPAEGTDPALAARSAREELSSRLEQRRKTEERAGRELEVAEEALAGARAQRDQSDYALREARRRLDEAAEEASRTTWLAERRSERGEQSGGDAVKRARLEAELAAERRHADSAKLAAEARERDQQRLRTRIALERETLPGLERAGEALAAVAERLERHADALGAPVGEEGGGEVAAALRQCSQQEYELQSKMSDVSERHTTAEVEASELRRQRDEGVAELKRLGETLERELPVAEQPLPEAEREEIETKLTRVDRRREQIGPVNPLAKREYEEASEHVKDLTAQRKDMESALQEVRSLIRRTDKEIGQAFEETFEATARNFEEMTAELFPGGKGRLRRIDVVPKAVPSPQNGGAPEGEEAEGEDEESDDYGAPKDEAWGVEIEVTPSGKSTRRLSLLSGGEKSLVALAFVFAVLMARPCPFYILDEVEAALDDINIDRFLRLVRRFAERSQFIVVTHQKRTMDAADILYGVSMGGDGVTKVVSRKLPRDGELQPGDVPEADAAAAEAEAA